MTATPENNGNPKRLDARAIFAASKGQILMEDVPVEQWDGTVTVRVMNAAAKDRFELIVAKASEVNVDLPEELKAVPPNWRALMATLCCCDQEGKLIFTDNVRIAHNEEGLWDDVNRVSDLDHDGLSVVCAAAMRINGMTDDHVKELAGN